MRSAKKSQKKEEKSGMNLSGGEFIELANTVSNTIKSGFDFLKEMEKTKQAAIDAQVRIVDSNNRLATELAGFEKDIYEIQKKFEIESKKLDNEHEVKMKQLELIEKLVDKIDKIEIEIKVYQEKDGLTSTSVMSLFEHLHQQKLAYMNNLVLLGQN